MTQHRIGMAIALAALMLGSGAAHATTIDIQPIDVCDTDGTGCANGEGLLSSYQNYTNAIWSRAGISFAFLPVEHYDNSAYVNLGVNPTGVTDPGRQLMRLPGHGQSSSADTLNMFFVPQLQDATGLQTLYAYSFTGGNGMIIGPSPRPDTIAHELGHNFGLDHTTFGAGGARNLMTDGSARAIPPGTSASQVSSGAYDQLTAAQIAQARSPLFSVQTVSLLTQIEASVSAPLCLTIGCFFGHADLQTKLFSPTIYPNGCCTPVTPASGLPTEQVTDVKFRFLPGTFGGSVLLSSSRALISYTDPVTGSVLSQQNVSGTYSVLADGTEQFEIPLTGGSLSPFMAWDTIDLTVSDFYGSLVDTPHPIPPFAMLYSFADGQTSQGFFDGTSTFDPGTGVTSYAIGTDVLTTEVSADEPGSLALLAFAALLVPAFRRSREACSSVRRQYQVA